MIKNLIIYIHCTNTRIVVIVLISRQVDKNQNSMLLVSDLTSRVIYYQAILGKGTLELHNWTQLGTIFLNHLIPSLLLPIILQNLVGASIHIESFLAFPFHIRFPSWAWFLL